MTRTLRVGAGALAGAALGLVVGLVAVALAPENGFADLAAGALTTVVIVPGGALAGAITAWWTGRRQR
jgi:hypothetical protein